MIRLWWSWARCYMHAEARWQDRPSQLEKQMPATARSGPRPSFRRVKNICSSRVGYPR